MTRARRLLVSGYYGAGNLGDEALLAGLLAGLARCGGFVPTVLSASPAATRSQHGVASVHRVAGAPWALLGADALLSGGGGLLQDATSRRSLDYYLGLVRAARALGRRVVVYGQSLGPLSAEGRDRVGRVLRGVPIALRDRPSLELAAELGLDAVPTADAALLLEPGGSGGSVAHQPAATGVVLVPRGGHPRATEVLAAVAREATRAGHEVAVAAFHPHEDDAEAARVVAAAPGATRLALATPQDALAAFAPARVVVSARLHGLVLAAVAGAPHAGLAYDPKVRGFAEATGAPCMDVPRDAAGVATVAGAIGGFVSRPTLDRARVAAARRAAADGVTWLARTLGSAAARPDA